ERAGRWRRWNGGRYRGRRGDFALHRVGHERHGELGSNSPLPAAVRGGAAAGTGPGRLGCLGGIAGQSEARGCGWRSEWGNGGGHLMGIRDRLVLTDRAACAFGSGNGAAVALREGVAAPGTVPGSSPQAVSVHGVATLCWRCAIAIWEVPHAAGCLARPVPFSG